jgi:2-amino-4-hydroxy-6-hydroxymethyldihydropteridine diphosphokinase
MKTVHHVFLLLGSNEGDRLMNIHQAIMDIHLLAEEVKGISSIYETSPWGVDKQQNYLNVAIHITTHLYPYGLMWKLEQVERQMGRYAKGDLAPRRMDIDILLFDDLQLISDKLIIPHPRMHLRKFVLQPLSELAPEIMIPGIKLKVREMLEQCKDEGLVSKYIQQKHAL